MFDADMYAPLRDGTRASADVIVPLIVDTGKVVDVIDVGCGEGWFARAFARRGCKVVACDGSVAFDHVEEIDAGSIAWRSCDLTSRTLPGSMSDHWDLAVCLEVAEHLPAEYAADLVGLLVGAADAVLFSAAIPGQGGQGHVNEQWPRYWADLFSGHDYLVTEWPRWLIWDDDRVEPWYRQNLLLYATREWTKQKRHLEWQIRPRDVVHPAIFSVYRG